MSSAPEVEWDDTERAWMLALDEHRREAICPSCGWPKAICQAPESEWAVEATRLRCHVTTALRRAQKAYGEAPGAEPDGLVWGAQLRTPPTA